LPWQGARRAGRGNRLNLELAEVVGRLIALRRFPIEGIAGEAPTEAFLRGDRLSGDRLYELADEGTARAIGPGTHPFLLSYSARYLDDPEATGGRAWVQVRWPDGRDCAATDPSWLSEATRIAGRPVALRARPRDSKDAAVRILSVPTRRRLEKVYGGELEEIRFRENLLIDLPDAEAFEEDGWVGRRLRIGEALLEVTGHASDCVLADLAIPSGERDASLLSAMVKMRNGKIGLEARVVSGSRIRAADPILLLE
jgi:uncharacterized protein YcbX